MISVDGAWDAPGLNLSHWPGNRTPRELRHDLSTGTALAFSGLGEPRQRELAGAAVAIVNNHYDTDGTCALFAVRHPELALPRAEALLRAARAGDFYQAPDEDALAVDAIVEGFADPERSPIAAELRGLDDPARHDLATRRLLERLPEILDGRVAAYAELFEPVLRRYRGDLADLAACARDDIVHLDLSIWTAPADARSSDPEARGFDPSRHALFGSSGADRVLVLATRGGGTTCRFAIGTRSWFDLREPTTLPRPDLRALARRLNELEGSGPADAVAWRTQGALGASPELWFGRDGVESFSEHNPGLEASSLSPGRVRREIADALRERLVLQ